MKPTWDEVERAEREGRLRPASGRCGPWIVTGKGEGEREECVKCGDVSYPNALYAMRFGPRSYTAEQEAQIRSAVAKREPLSPPALEMEESDA